MRLSSSSFGYANGAGGAPVDGSISRRSVRGGARMTSGDLCKLASCVSGIQMALNLCLLCSPGQRGGGERRRKRGELLLTATRSPSGKVHVFVFLSSYDSYRKMYSSLFFYLKLGVTSSLEHPFMQIIK